MPTATRYSITEPHPTASKIMFTGRGGAGNSSRATKYSSSSTTVTPSQGSLLAQDLPIPGSKCSSGRGGAGNIRLHLDNRPRVSYSFDEELARQTSRDQRLHDSSAVQHIGRGGAGNWASVNSVVPSSARTSSSRKDSMSSAGSDDSVRSGFFARLGHALERK